MKVRRGGGDRLKAVSADKNCLPSDVSWHSCADIAPISFGRCACNTRAEAAHGDHSRVMNFVVVDFSGAMGG
jgi:hypothetical protein